MKYQLLALFGAAWMLFIASAHAQSQEPFRAICEQGETQRYDGGNGKNISGGTIPSSSYGWSTEKWGDLEITWRGDDALQYGNALAYVAHVNESEIVAFWYGEGGTAFNMKTVVVDRVTGIAMVTQTQTSAIGQNRSVKIRAQNLDCSFYSISAE